MALINRRVFSSAEISCLTVTPYSPYPRYELVKLGSIHNKKCVFCGEKDNSERLYGFLYEREGLVTHYYCILFASRVPQNGSSSDGIWGFLIDDIRLALNRESRQRCSYCNKRGATIRCCERGCRKIFHLPCGLRNGSMHQYFENFKSFCRTHRITQYVDIQALQGSTPIQCCICMEDVSRDPSLYIWAPCCKSNWFHRNCLQKMALHFGMQFKCPMCNSEDIFLDRMRNIGIFIPYRCASWLDNNDNILRAFEYRIMCYAMTCLCSYSEGRFYSETSGNWNLILCTICGDGATHFICSQSEINRNGEWLCKLCRIRRSRIAVRRMNVISNLSEENAISNNRNNSRIQHYIQPPNSVNPPSPMIESVTSGSRTSDNPSSSRRQPPHPSSQAGTLQPYAYIDLTLDDD